MASRLDRLFLLLETGSSPLTRKAAALQIGEVQKMHPHELHNLLAKVRKYLYSNSWDTRIAAGQAVEAIISHVPVWCPDVSVVKEEKEKCGSSNATQAGRMKFSEFDINKVIENGSDLLASEGSEFELAEVAGVDVNERLAKQRENLNKRLGLPNGIDVLEVNSNELFCDEDLTIDLSEKTSIIKRSLSDAYDSEMTQTSLNLSCQTMGRGKLKRTKNQKIQLSEDKSCDNEPLNKKARMSSLHNQNAFSSGDNLTNDLNLWEESKEWPFQSFCDELMQDLFHSAWVVRHGAATALREIVKQHGKGAGKLEDVSPDQMALMNELWLEDLALRLTCVLSLDKFGDFISDQVVAPVRETCAQALGVVLSIMAPAHVEGVLKILLQLMLRPEWEARHGGLLGLKYVLAIRQDMKDSIIPIVFDPVCKGLKDSIDDVSAVAASALVPVTQIVVATLPHKVSSVVLSLWDALPDLDDLTVSTSSILELLAALLFHDKSFHITFSQSLDTLVPRLWPFVSHNSSGVRKSVLQALNILTSNNNMQGSIVWLPKILPVALRLLYQRCLIEPITEIHSLLFKVWENILTYSSVSSVVQSSVPYLSYWLSLLMQPVNAPIDPSSNSAWLDVHCKPTDKCPERGRKSSENMHKKPKEYFYLGGNETLSDNFKEREKCAMQAKITAAKFLGVICSLVTSTPASLAQSPDSETPVESFSKLIIFHLNYKSALQRLAVSLVLSEWAKCNEEASCPLSVKEKCLQCLNENIYYDEIGIAFTRLQQDCKDFIIVMKQNNVPIDSSYTTGSVLTFEQIITLATDGVQTALSSGKLTCKKKLKTIEDRRNYLLQNAKQTSQDLVSLTVLVQAAVAGALVSLKFLPEKLNPVIRPLMDSIKLEENDLMQRASAGHIVHLMEQCLQRPTCPNAKIVKNVIHFLCCNMTDDTLYFNKPNLENKDNQDGIITLINMKKCAERAGFRRCNSSAKKSQSSENTLMPDAEFEIRKRGSTFVLTQAVQHYGVELPQKLPQLWESTFHTLSNCISSNAQDADLQSSHVPPIHELICSLRVLEVIAPHLHLDLKPELEKKLPQLCVCLEHPHPIIRHLAARCFGALSRVITSATMNVIFDEVLKRLAATDNDVQRQGAVEGLSWIIEELELNIVPYIVFLIIPLLGRMSDQNEHVRTMATHCFALLIKLMPLEAGTKETITLRSDLADRKVHERRFLEQLMNPKKLEPYVIPVEIKAELRSYQQEGVNWLAFLNQYKLHGILCDDMGLGKTLQSICILAGDHYYREKKYKQSKDPDYKPLSSLVICPPTLTGHWVYEIEKFVCVKQLKPLHYTGPPTERIRLRSRAKHHNLIIASYDIVRNDIDFFGTIHWNYCILDEGHAIKNGKTKLACAIKKLSANHRLILSGTPIQNNVLELWSLFDFLMPGFLGTEKQFTARYSKPILLSRDSKSSSKEQEAGALAMESLHRQTLPFLLRRMKEDVLQDLPPKIIQDYYCELSALQVRLYEDFSKSRAKKGVQDKLCEEQPSITQGSSHVFQALQYLRKVCNHPKLVLTPKHPEYEAVTAQLKEQKSSLSNVQHAAKLCALKQLLLDCGIGTSSVSTTAQNEPENVVNQHRALIFCQLKSMLDILENDLFQSLMPGVSYLRLDGSIPAGDRHGVVNRFNNDPSIDVLILTTQVGGLGLNLTGADTVIFVEHDWNPMKDLQAMDRAHRIGQKKVVNVYRLITRGTLEEKIMGLQKFKLSIANSIINQENSSLQDMGTDQVLDLFTLDDQCQKLSNTASGNSSNSNKGIKSFLDNLPELWDTDQYETEYDLNTFLQSLSPK